MARASLVLAVFLAMVGCSHPQCVIDTDCPLGQYCDNTPGGAGGSCQAIGSGGGTDSGPTSDTGPQTDTGPRTDGGARDTGPAMDTGAPSDSGASDAASSGG
jgi:hypothetical protein